MGSLQSPPRRTAARVLSPDSLAKDFAGKAEIARQGVRALYEAILAAEPPGLQDWKTLLGKASGHDPCGPSADIERLAAYYDHSCGAVPAAGGGLRPDAMLFALHTYYALVVRLLVGQIIAHRRGLPAPLEGLLRADGVQRLRLEMEQIEAGVVSGGTGMAAPGRDDPFGWYTAEWHWRHASGTPIERMVRQLAARLAEYDPATLPKHPEGTRAGNGDLLGQFYQGLFPAPLRHRLGEYYTPRWLADHVLDVAGYSGEPDRRLLDPACGSGTFLVEAIGRIRRWHQSDGGRVASGTGVTPVARQWHARLGEGELCRQILTNVVGCDLNPLAVITAKANYLMALGDLLPHSDGVEIPVHLCDSILDGPPSLGRFDYVVGNPPWIAWDNLPAEYREATKPLWRRYGLFSLSGSQSRHGGAKKDLSMLMTYASADRFLKHGGRLAMVITQTLWQTKGAGDGFRRFRLGSEGEPLRVLRVDDMAALRPFPDATNSTSTILLEKGAPTQYPVPYIKWSPSDVGQAFQPDDQIVSDVGQFFQPDGRGDVGQAFQPDDRLVRLGSLTYGIGGMPVVRQMYQAEPIDPRQPGSPWFVRPEGLQAELARLVGPSDYVAHLGANSGGANGVYWVQVLGQAAGGVLVRNLAQKNKHHLQAVEQVVEPDLLYPLVRWADVARYRVMPSAHILLAQDVATRTGIDPAVMRREYPQTYAYLQRFEPVLSGRAAYRQYQQCKAFYSMYNVGRYTVAPIKVVWRRMDRRIRAAVAQQADDLWLGPRPVIPQETCVLVAAESTAEAHYICAVLNSSLVNFLVSSHSVCGGKGFGTPGMLDFVKLRRFDSGDPRHAELAVCSRMAHLAVACGNDPTEAQHRIDQLAGELWGLGPSELRAIAPYSSAEVYRTGAT